MFTSYVKIAIRNLLKHRIFSFINICGLAIGIACCILILMYVLDELKYDRFHANRDRIFRIVSDAKTENAPVRHYATSSRHIASVLREHYPEVEQVVRLYGGETPQIKHQGRYFEEKIFFAEPTFFDIFSFSLLEGDPNSALQQPYSVVLTEETAQKFFGDKRALGETLSLDDSLSLKVTGVMADPPRHSHLSFDALVSWSTYDQQRPPYDWEWANFWMYTYVLLRDGASPALFENKISDLTTRQFGERLAGIGLEIKLGLEKLPDIYLHSGRSLQSGVTGDIRYLYVFSSIALLVLIIACINFVNLCTARSLDRAKEVGLRKAVGSQRRTLIWQFLSETVVVAFLATILALAIVTQVLPIFNDLATKNLTLSGTFDPFALLAILAGFVAVIGLLAGSYPAFALSSFRPVDVLKGKFKSSRQGLWLRRVLVVFQFVLSVVLITGTLVIYRQLNFMKREDLGFNKEQILVMDATQVPSNKMLKHHQLLKNGLLGYPFVDAVTVSSRVPGRGRGGGVMFPEGLPEGQSREVSYFSADYDFLETFGIDIIAGRQLQVSFETDTRDAALINEAAVANFGWRSPEEATGKTVVAGWDGKPLTVVGVFKDYHHLALREPISPTLTLIRPSWYGYVSAHIAPGQTQAAIAAFKETWEEHFPEYTFSYFFLDQDYDRQYRTEEKLAQIFAIFAVLAIVIACLGLFGIVTLIARQRTKEIGIRKTLGATWATILALVSKDFIKLVVLANILGWPLTWLAMNRWLQDFAYHIDISWWFFAIAGGLSLGIALLTVSIQALRAAFANPVEALRYE